MSKQKLSFVHNMRFLLIIIFLLAFSCKDIEKKVDEKQPSIEELELMVRQDQDRRAVFEYSDYEKIMTALKAKQCIVLPLYQMKDFFDSTKVIVGLKHDVDRHPFKALEIASIEKKYGFTSTYYFLPTAPYYGKLDTYKKFIRYFCLDEIYLKIFLMGHEIGIHNDLLTVMIDWDLDPFEFNKYTISEFNKIGIPIYGTSSHGANICYSVKHYNFEIFSEFTTSSKIEYAGKTYQIGQKTLKQYSFSYEAYHIDYNIYFTDVGGHWVINKSSKGYMNFFEKSTKNNCNLEEIIKKIENAKPGDRIVILTHPLWWGKKRNK